MHIDINNDNGQSQKEGMSEKDINKPRPRYQINWKKLRVLIGAVVLVLMLVAGSWWFFTKRDKGDDPVKVYDVAVVLKDQHNPDPEEDRKESLKAGDVALARETGREWSKTERIGYLIIKMKLKESQMRKLTEPVTEKLSKKEAEKKGLLPDPSSAEATKGKGGEKKNKMSKEELNQLLTQTVQARKYRIKIEDLDFDPAKVRQNQPFPDREFGWEIVESKVHCWFGICHNNKKAN